MTDEGTQSQAQTTASKTRTPRWPRLLLVSAGLLVALCVGGWGFAYWNQNQAQMSPEEFAAALDDAIARAAPWFEANRELAFETNANVSMYYLVRHMNDLHATPVLADGLAWFLAQQLRPGYLKKLVDPSRRVLAAEMNADLANLSLDYRWLTYAMGPDKVKLSEQDLADLFDAEKFDGLVLAHQLWALYHLRRLNPEAEVDDELVRRICERMAAEHARDVLYHQLHAERVAFLMLAGHADLVKQRWFERIIELQTESGGWRDRWYALNIVHMPGPHLTTDEHITIIALSALYIARYEYPEVFGPPSTDGGK